uniref:Uncharacterized protein n=1 Tax=Candidatus Kentrum sp. FW TaxID=2126338 RepID=A0A450TTF4_9GAMM|nr:MAG: hypothetical protein BECKFW1821B_GA0114236_12484 [Candidatus Kentron sp. FW]
MSAERHMQLGNGEFLRTSISNTPDTAGLRNNPSMEPNDFLGSVDVLAQPNEC